MKNNQIALYGIMLREVLIMYIIISVSIIVSAYMIYNQMENMSRIYSCALDGIVVWCTSSMLNSWVRVRSGLFSFGYFYICIMTYI